MTKMEYVCGKVSQQVMDRILEYVKQGYDVLKMDISWVPIGNSNDIVMEAYIIAILSLEGNESDEKSCPS